MLTHYCYCWDTVPISLAVKINARKLHSFSSISLSPLITLYSLSNHKSSPISFTSSTVQIHLGDLVVFVFKLYAICFAKSSLILFSPRSCSNLCSCLLTGSVSNFWILETFSLPQKPHCYLIIWILLLPFWLLFLFASAYISWDSVVVLQIYNAFGVLQLTSPF